MILAFDVVLVLALIGVAGHIIWAREHFQAVVVFITFGLLLSMAWTRLNALDIAITEAGIGAGLSGVLLLNALRSLSNSKPELNSKVVACLILPWTGLMGLLLLPAYFPLLSPELSAQALHISDATSLIPIAAGAIFYIMARKHLSRLMRGIRKTVPDLAAGMELIWYKGTAGLRQSSLTQARWMEMNLYAVLDQAISSDFGWERMRHGEYRAAKWPVFGFWFIVLIVILAGLSSL